MDKKMMLVVALIVLMIVFAVAPAYAEKPTVVEDVWFVWSLTGGATTGNDVTWTGDGAILHNNATYTWNLNRSPPGAAGSVVIGTVVTQSNLQFNTKTEEGNIVVKATLTFTSTDPALNPYGVGTLECIAVAKITSMNTLFTYVPGTGEGFIVGTDGTGAFENAKLTADFVFSPIYIPGTSTVWTEGMFFGFHERVNGEGTIVYHNAEQ